MEKRHVDGRFGTNHALGRRDLPSLLLQQDDACRATRHGKICGFSVRNVIRGRLKLFAVTVERRGNSAIRELSDHGKGDLRHATEHSSLHDGGRAQDGSDHSERFKSCPSPFHNNTSTSPFLRVVAAPEMKAVRGQIMVPCVAELTSSPIQQIH